MTHPAIAHEKTPLKLVTSTVEAALICVGKSATREAAQRAVTLLNTLCRTAPDNRPLVYAINAGVLELLRALNTEQDAPAIVGFVRFVCEAVFQARVSPAICRRYPERFASRYAGPDSQEQTAWDTIAHMADISRDIYMESRQPGRWRRSLPCGTLQVCP
ncbi:hypothetical protein EV715DRAFT_297726 [Schizophyllum commune]